MYIGIIESRQKAVDRFYKENGPCCAGCDYWRWINSVAGECVRFPPKVSKLSNDDAVLTLRDHWCAEFKDTFDWSTIK